MSNKTGNYDKSISSFTNADIIHNDKDIAHSQFKKVGDFKISRRNIINAIAPLAISTAAAVAIPTLLLANEANSVSPHLKQLIENYDTALDAFHNAIDARETAESDWEENRPVNNFKVCKWVKIDPCTDNVPEIIKRYKIKAKQASAHLSTELAQAIEIEANAIETDALIAWGNAIEVEDQRREAHGVAASIRLWETTCQAELDAREAIAEYPARTEADRKAKAVHMRRIMSENDIQDFEIEGLIRALEA